MATRVKDFSAPTSNIDDLTFDGKSLYAIDSSTQNIYKLDKSGNIERTITPSVGISGTIVGLCSDDRYLYVGSVKSMITNDTYSITTIDKNDGEVIKNINGNTVSSSLYAFFGLAYDGKDFIYGQYLQSINPHPTGLNRISKDGTYIAQTTIGASLNVGRNSKLCYDGKDFYILGDTESGKSTATESPGAEGTNSWTNPSNARTSNNTCATASGGTTGFWDTWGFNLPAWATITDISVDCEWCHASNGSRTSDVNVGKSEGTMGTAQTHASGATGTCSSATVKTENGLWGLSWTPAEINSDNFTVSFKTNTGGGTRYLDSLAVTVTYTDGMDLFKVSRDGTLVRTDEVPGKSGSGITFDNKDFWITDTGTDEIAQISR